MALCLARNEDVIKNLETLESVLENYQQGDNDDINLLDENMYEELKKMSKDSEE